MSNKLMVFGRDRKKRRKKVTSEKNQGLRHRGGGRWKFLALVISSLSEWSIDSISL